MAFALTWKVEFGDCTGLTDITSYVMSLNITSDATLGKMGRASAAVTINNIGGQFTPNGTGTYGATDWFGQALVITSISGANTGTSFVGIITNVQNNDISSKEAYFTFEALDWVSVAGRATTSTFGSGVGDMIDYINSMLLDGYAFMTGQVFRTTMNSNTSTRCNLVFDREEGNNTPSVFQQDSAKYPASGTSFYIGDAINNVTLPSFPSTMYATSYIRTASLWTWGYDFQYVGSRTTRANTFTFKGDGTALTSGQLPFDTANIGFQIDEMINTAIVGTVTDTATTSMIKYGTRAVSYTNPGTNTVSDYQLAADNWTNRYSLVRYIPDTISLDYSSLRGSAVDDGVAMLQFMYLLWPAYSLWNRLAITVKGSGQTSATTYQVISTKTTINATPSDTLVTVTLVSGPDNSSFILDSTTYGILDTNRLG